MNYKLWLVPILALSTSGPLHAADINHGMTLQQAKCMSCHDDGMYIKENRRVTSLPGLKKQVRRCELGLGYKWFDADIDDVTEYLNTNYYKFK